MTQPSKHPGTAPPFIKIKLSPGVESLTFPLLVNLVGVELGDKDVPVLMSPFFLFFLADMKEF